MTRRHGTLVALLTLLGLIGMPAAPVAAQDNAVARVQSPPSAGTDAASEVKEPDPEEEDRGCGQSVSTLAADLQKQGDKGAVQAGAGIVSSYQAMRAACAEFRGCKVDCRKDKRSCKAGAKSEKQACIAECAKKSGRERRVCRRECRRDKRDDVRDCRDDKRSCKDECRDEMLDDDCVKGRRAFWASLGRAQQASKGDRAKGPQAPKTVCAPLYAD